MVNTNLRNRKRNRFQDYDYSRNGVYFITICTKDKNEYFGRCQNGKIFLNELGNLAQRFWQEIPEHYDKILIDEFIVMPNHIHGILLIGNDNVILREIKSSNYGQLSKIVKSYKEILTKTIRDRYTDCEFGWQRSFYDHVIHNCQELGKIREYIKFNPIKWEMANNSVENWHDECRDSTVCCPNDREGRQNKRSSTASDRTMSCPYNSMSTPFVYREAK